MMEAGAMDEYSHSDPLAALDRDWGPVPPVTAAVTRVVGASFGDLSALLDDHDVQERLAEVSLGDLGRLTIDLPLRRIDGPYQAWRGRGRLHGRGPRVARSTRVDLELTPWSATAVELRLLPTHPHPSRWGRRRLRRYLDLAHLAADQLAAMLHRPAPAAGAIRRITPRAPIRGAA
jgi:hypothetical protein